MEPISQKIITELKTLTRKTGDVLLQEFNKKKPLKAKFKGKHDIVLQADLIAEKIILKKLNQLTPSWQILSEEKGDNHKKSDYLWLVDPLDGTTNFFMGNPLFATQIALLYKKEPILGFIYAPYLKEFYFAQKGKGAFLNNTKIKISNRGINQALITYCHGTRDKDIKNIIKIYTHYKLHHFDMRQLGSAAIEFGWVAKGQTDCYLSPGANPWDIAPGALIVNEAGGSVVDFKGKTWNLDSKNAFAHNKIVDKPILKFLSKLK